MQSLDIIVSSPCFGLFVSLLETDSAIQLVATYRSNVRWCSDVFRIQCDNGEHVEVVFVLDCRDREVISWACLTRGIDGGDAVCIRRVFCRGAELFIYDVSSAFFLSRIFIANIQRYISVT